MFFQVKQKNMYWVCKKSINGLFKKTWQENQLLVFYKKIDFPIKEKRQYFLWPRDLNLSKWVSVGYLDQNESKWVSVGYLDNRWKIEAQSVAHKIMLKNDLMYFSFSIMKMN